VALSRAFLLEHSAPGSDAGLCVTAVEAVADGITAFGTRAKREVVKVAEASELAASIGAHLEGLTGTGLGVIGALAAVGLRAAANDGRFLWLPRLRETLRGVYGRGAARRARVWTRRERKMGRRPGNDARVAVGDWPRPLLRGGRRVFLIQEAVGEDYQWVGADKQRLKATLRLARKRELRDRRADAARRGGRWRCTRPAGIGSSCHRASGPDLDSRC
jgi:hypothetical protein